MNNCVFGLPDGLRLDIAGDLVLTNGAALHLFAAPVANPLTKNGALVTVGGSLLAVELVDSSLCRSHQRCDRRDPGWRRPGGLRHRRDRRRRQGI